MQEIMNAILAVIAASDAVNKLNVKPSFANDDFCRIVESLSDQIRVQAVNAVYNSEASHGLTQKEISLIYSGGKISAIKEFRTRTGMGLKESKDKVEAYMDKYCRADYNANGIMTYVPR